VIAGLQLTLSALSFDVDRQPSRPVHPLLRGDEPRTTKPGAAD